MTTNILRIATRESPLALWQAQHVASRLQAIHAGLEVKLIGMKTEGDRFLEAPLSRVGGKGLFVKELEQCLLAGEADIAVHSMKDVTVDFPDGLHLPIIMVREDPRDAFIANDHDCFADLPVGACVGTSSLRRQCQLAALRPDLEIRSLRGNVGTRLGKLDAGDYDAIILAAAGVRRLGLESRVRQYLEPDVILPAIGQGAIGIEARIGDQETLDRIQPLNDADTTLRVLAERSVSKQLYGGCQLPIAAHAELTQDTLRLRGLVGRVDGSEIITAATGGPASDAIGLGVSLAEELLSKGADQILKELINP